MNYQSVVLTFDSVSYRANWYSLTFETDPSYCFISQAQLKHSRLICMAGYNGSPSACHFKRPHRSHAHILSTTNNSEKKIKKKTL